MGVESASQRTFFRSRSGSFFRAYGRRSANERAALRIASGEGAIPPIRTFTDTGVRRDASGEPNGEVYGRDAALIDQIRDAGGMQAYVKQIPNFKDAFVGNVQACICCDGRISTRETVKGPAVYLPGANLFQEHPELLAHKLHEAGILYLYSHYDCGAAKGRYRQTHGKDPDPAELDAFAQEETREFCKKYGFEFKGHINTPGLRDPHSEQILYFDATPTQKGSKKMARSKVDGHLPPGFKFTADLSDNRRRDLITLLGIAFDHGAGPWLVKHGRKFLVCVIGATDAERDRAIAEVRGWIAAAKEPIRSHVAVDGFTVPA